MSRPTDEEIEHAISCCGTVGADMIRRLYAALIDDDFDCKSIQSAINCAVEYGGIDGSHHKTWVIDQMVRMLAGNQYDAIVAGACCGDDGPNTYSWDCGVAP